MGWKGFMRDLAAAGRRAERARLAEQRQQQRAIAAQERAERQAVAAERRAEREAVARHKQLLNEMREAEKLGEQARARSDVALYENYLARLLSMHKECWLPWSWNVVATNPPPPQAIYLARAETEAQAAAARYSPSLTDRVTGHEANIRAQLNNTIVAAREQDQQQYRAAMDLYSYEYGRWEWLRSVAGGVLAGDPRAYEAVVAHLAPFEELSELGSDVSIAVRQSWCVEATLRVRDADVIPNEIYSLTAKGSLSTKKMPKAQYWALYQDHVCSCALRVAREVFALLPVDVALVQVQGLLLNKATGHQELQPILSVGFTRATVDRLNLDAIDPSDSMQNFSHRMDFAKSAGFRSIEPFSDTDFAPAATAAGSHA